MHIFMKEVLHVHVHAHYNNLPELVSYSVLSASDLGDVQSNQGLKISTFFLKFDPPIHAHQISFVIMTMF